MQDGGVNSRTRNVEARQKSRAARQKARQENRTERARIRANDPRSLKEKIFGNTTKRNTNNYTPKPEPKTPKPMPEQMPKAPKPPMPESPSRKPKPITTPQSDKYKKYFEDMPNRKKGGSVSAKMKSKSKKK